MKYLVSIGVVALLFIFPLISWYYLDNGLTYRKQLEQETDVKGSVFEFVDDQDSVYFNGFTTLWQIDGSIDNEDLFSLYDQFKDAPSFQILGNDDINKPNVNPAILNFNKSDKLNGVSIILVDTVMQIRKYYKGWDEKVIKDIVAHTAVTLPIPQERDIKMKIDESR